LVDNLTLKADIFKARFFPTAPIPVDPVQDTDPPPRATCDWMPITTGEVTAALKTMMNDTALGPSGIGYRILTWAHAARPDALTDIFNAALESGTHPWHEGTVVVLNKPSCPDYSLAKVYQPISLLECIGKLMEKIVTKRFNRDILIHNLLPSTQFRSRPHHTAIDAVAVLVHHIQATHTTDNAGALLLFDISGFYDNLNPAQLVAILCPYGFPPHVCAWVHSFLTDHTARLCIGNFLFKAFPITHSTPQGSPLSPILSAFYTATLLEHATFT